MADTFIYKHALRELKPLFWRGAPVFTQYHKLRNFLRQHLGDAYAIILSQPEIGDLDSVNEMGVWIADNISKEARPITAVNDLSAIEQLTHKISVIRDFAEQLKNSQDEEKKVWATLITASLHTPSESFIFFDSIGIVLTGWGFTFSDSSRPEYLLEQKFYRSGEKIRTASSMSEVDQVTERTEDEAAFIPDAGFDAFKPQPPESVIANLQKEEDHFDTNTNTNFADPKPLTGSKQETRKKEQISIVTPPWYKTRRVMWLLLLLLIPVLLLFCNCSKGGKTILPKEAGKVVPVDSTKLISDSSNIKLIVGDRINIALTGANKDIIAFAEEFNKFYPSEVYKIIYYDTVIHRIQVELPVDKREELKRELKNKMKGYELLIWYESIYQQNKQPNDPAFTVPDESWYQRKVKATDAWDVTQGDSSLIIAVIDDGFDIIHREFLGKVVKPWNILAHSAGVNTGKGFFHGTHVAGIALALANNNFGGSGIAPNCRLMPIQVGDKNGMMSSTAIIDAVLYAIHNGASVVNMSLGVMAAPGVEKLPEDVQLSLIKNLYKDEEQMWDELFTLAYEKNITMVLAGGNQGVLMGLDPMQRSNKTIKVSATDLADKKAEFSNYGPYSTISAPGVSIYSSVPGNRFDFLDGTSMASPIVAGGVALLKSANPSMSFDELVALLQSTGIPVDGSDGYVGNIMQLDRALDIAKKKRDEMPVAECPDVQNEIDSLLQEIDRLRRKCRPGLAGTDTLKIPPGTNDPSFTKGKWKSTSTIYSTLDGKTVTLYFEFDGMGNGSLTLVESDNTVCGAPLKLGVKNGDMLIKQQNGATCNPPPKKYQPYTFKCKADNKGCAECQAQNLKNINNKFLFNLIKIN